MKKSGKIEILIPTWEGRSGYGYWGGNDYGSFDNHSTSFWLSLRGMLSSEPYGFLNDECRSIGVIGLYVWVSVEGSVSIDLRLHDVGSMTLFESVQRNKVLKRLFAKAKAYPFNNFRRDSDVHTELTKVLDALGVKRSFVYHGVGTSETFEPVGIAIKRISDCIDGQLHSMKQRQVA